MSKTILLADDSMTIQKVVELTFMDQDYEVVAVSDGSTALDKLGDVNPDLVIADVHMPGADGYEVCRQTKAASAGTPVLLLVGTFEEFDEGQAEAAGADGHLKKPFDSQELLKKVVALASGESAAPAAPAAPEAPELQTQPAAPQPAAPQPAAAPQPEAAPPQAAPPDTPQVSSPEPAAPQAEAAPTPPSQPAAQQSQEAAEPQPEAAPSPPPVSTESPDITFATADSPTESPQPEAEAVPTPTVPEVAAPDPAVPEVSAPEGTPAATPGSDDLRPSTVETRPTQARGPDGAPAADEATSEATPVEAAPESESAPTPEPEEAAAAPAPEPAEDEAEVEEEEAAASANGSLSDADVERIARKVIELSGGVAVKEVVWEVVPDLAEVVIRERISELEADVE